MTKKATMQATRTAAAGRRPSKAATRLDVVTTASGRVGAFGYTRGIILKGVPVELTKVHETWMDADPAAVKAAHAAGADVVPFRS